MAIDVPNIAAGVLLGAIPTALASWYVYARQKRESAAAHAQLIARLDKLHELLEAQLAGQRVEVERDDRGRITGGHVLHAEPARYVLTGQPVTLRAAGVPDAESRARGIT